MNQRQNSNSETNDEDWKIDVSPCCKVKVPSFVRLFIIRRILINYSDQVQIYDLVSEIADTNERDIAKQILTGLLKDGIKTYMSSHWSQFDEQKQIKGIETIFNQIILPKFGQKYQDTITFSNCNSNSQTLFQTQVFNMDDIMCCIFQFVKLDEDMKGDLFNCSLVSSQWLYYVYNPNSIYFFDLTKLVHKTLQDLHAATVTRVWQRLTKVKKIYIFPDFEFDDEYGDVCTNIRSRENTSFGVLLTKLSMLRNIIALDVSLDLDDINILKVIMSQCKNNIKLCTIYIVDSKLKQDGKVLSPLMLMNCQEINLYNLYFYIGWTKVLKTLNLLKLRNINNQWCQYVISNCDCTGINKLNFDEVSFTMNKNIERKVLTKLASKFENLMHFDLRFENGKLDKSVSLFWKLLAPIIKKNKTYVTLFTHSITVNIDDNLSKNKIDQLCISFHGNQNLDSVKSVILNSNPEYLSLDTWTYGKNILTSIIKILQDINNEKNALPRLRTRLQKIQCRDGDLKRSMSVVNDFIKCIKNIVSKTKIALFIVVNFKAKYVNSQSGSDNEFLLWFNTFCQCLLSLMVKDQVPIDVELQLKDINQVEFEKYKDLAYNLYFTETTFLNNYKKPKCNKYCHPLVKPKILFKFEVKNNRSWATLHVINAQSAR